MKGFIWNGTDVVNGGKCVVAWSRVEHPFDLEGKGGGGVMDLSGYREWLCV
jgi:hypothetical protein